MSNKLNRKAVFFDRDGTINIEKNYVFKKEDFEFRPGIFELMRSYVEQHYLLFVVTNQSGIARGYYSENEFQELTRWMVQELAMQGIPVEKVYHCPHHPEITGPCECRKPNPGLIVQAIDEFNIDPKVSIMIGDSKRDISAGENAGLGKNLYIQTLL